MFPTVGDAYMLRFEEKVVCLYRLAASVNKKNMFAQSKEKIKLLIVVDGG